MSRSIRTARAAIGLAWRTTPAAVIGIALLSLVGAAAPPVAAWTGKLLFDGLASGASTGHVVLLAVAGSLSGAAALLTSLSATRVGEAARLRLAVAVETALFSRLNGLAGIAQFESPRFQYRLRLAEEGAQQAPLAVSQFGPDVVKAAVGTAGFLAVLLLVWPPIGLVVAVSALAGLVGQLALARRRAEAAPELARIGHRRLVYRMLLTDRDAVKEIRLFGAGDLLRTRMTDGLARANTRQLALDRQAYRTQLAMTLGSVAIGVVGLAVAAARAARGELTIGDVTLFTAALAAVQGNLSSLVVQYGSLATALDQFGHYLDVLDDVPDLPPGHRDAGPLRTGIELRDVWFRYDEDGPWVLRGVTLTIPAGTALGLVGLNGAGKSTLVALLCRFYDPVRGQVLWDGEDLRCLEVTSLRRRIRAAFQDFMRYDLTAAENIGIGDLPRLRDRERIAGAAGRAEVAGTLAGLRDGYDTLLSRIVLDEDAGQVGTSLSGGQWQRVALARSMLREDPDLLILDEPGAGLDADAEHRVHATLAAHRRGRTSVLVSHRLSALRDADRIVVLAGGRVAEEGSHAELVRAGGEYARLFALQASGYVDAPAGDPVEVAP